MNTAPTGVARLHPEHDTGVAEALLHLQIAAYRVEAALIGSHAIPGLTDTVDALRGAGSTWFGVVESGGPVGALALSETADEIDIERLVVAPHAFRRGIGRRLVGAALDHAGRRRVVVSTGRANAPARRLYESAGFRGAGHTEVEPGLWISHYAWEPPQPRRT